MQVEITSTIHVSNYCCLPVKCQFCGFAAGTSPEGYFQNFSRLSEDVKKAAVSIEKSGIRRVSLSAGYGNFPLVLKALETVKEYTNLKVLINVGGDLNKQRIKTLKSAGVDTICCNLETTNKRLFQKLKPSDSFEQRLKVCFWIKEEGIELSSGILLGIGETEKDREEHIKLLKKVEAEEIPLMRFQPYKGTPLENKQPPSISTLISLIEKVKVEINPKRITIPFPTIDYQHLVEVIKAGATNIATVIPEDYPFIVKGVAKPEVGILEKILPLLSSANIKTNVKTREADVKL